MLMEAVNVAIQDVKLDQKREKDQRSELICVELLKAGEPSVEDSSISGSPLLSRPRNFPGL